MAPLTASNYNQERVEAKITIHKIEPLCSGRYILLLGRAKFRRSNAMAALRKKGWRQIHDVDMTSIARVILVYY